MEGINSKTVPPIFKVPTLIKSNNSDIANYSNITELKSTVHDVNNFINTIINGIELLKENRENYDKFIYLIERIENSTYKISELVNNLLTSNKVAAQNQIQNINLNRLIKDVFNNIDNNLDNNIDLVLNLNAVDDIIQAKYSDIFRVLLNLLINAKEALLNNGKIIVNTSNFNFESNNYINITIEDNGVGIPEDYIKQIFDEGFTTKQKFSENGLGLFIVKNLVEKYNGKIEVKSKINNFTTFNISFLLIRKTLKENLINKTVLIAEDDPFQRELLSELINSLSLTVISTSNGSEALNQFLNNEIDLVIIDQSMPLMDGLSCINEMRKLNSNVPIILATGSVNESELKFLNNVKILSKPYNFQSIENLLSEIWK